MYIRPIDVSLWVDQQRHTLPSSQFNSELGQSARMSILSSQYNSARWGQSAVTTRHYTKTTITTVYSEIAERALRIDLQTLCLEED